MHRTTGDNYALDANGNRVFTEGPPPTTVDAGILNSIQEEIANAVEASGQTLYDTPGSDLNNQLALAIQKVAAYDSIVYSQETFNAIWERVGANEYQILDTIGSVYFKAYFGGYNMSGPNSPLSGGDTWGRFKTNACTFIMCDGGNFFQLGDTPSYWSITTSNTVVYNMDVRGVGAVDAAITKSIYIAAAAENCKLLFCTIKNRNSNVSHIAFEDGSTSAVLLCGTIVNCNVTGAFDFYGVYNFGRAANCYLYNILITGNGIFRGFSGIQNGSGNKIESCAAAGFAYGFYQCSNFTSSTVDTFTSDVSTVTGFYDCDQLSGCIVTNITGDIFTYGFYQCTGVSSCTCSSATNLDSGAYGFYQCSQITGSQANSISNSAQSAYGFYDCTELSGCKAYDIETSINNASYKAVGFQDCDQLSACTADTIAASAANAYAYGFNNCDRVSACHATTVTAATANRAYGFNDCDCMDGSNEATSIDDFEFYDCSQEPFRGNAAAATPYGFSTVWQSRTMTVAGSPSSWTAPKDGFLFGWGYQNHGTTYLAIKSGSTGGTYEHIERNDATGGAAGLGQAGSSFMLPVKAGVTYYFYTTNHTIYVDARFMPFGTTT